MISLFVLMVLGLEPLTSGYGSCYRIYALDKFDVPWT